MNLYQIEYSEIKTVDHGNDNTETQRHFQPPKWAMAETMSLALAKLALDENQIRIENVRLVSSNVNI